MRGASLPWLLVVFALLIAGCRSLVAEGSLKQPVALATPLPAQSPRAGPTTIPDLGKLAYVQGGDLWVKDLPDGKAKRLTYDSLASEPRWSPSGEWLAFRTEKQLRVIRPSGTDGRVVVEDDVWQFEWSPVDDRLAYAAAGGLAKVNADGSGLLELVAPSGRPGAGVLSMAWSPDGEWLTFSKKNVAKEAPKGQSPEYYAGLWRVRADGSQATEIFGGTIGLGSATPTGTNKYGGAIVAGWSPDGQRILFWSDPFSASLLADGTSLKAVAPKGGEPVEVSREMLARDDFLSWSPDGQSLALVDGGSRVTWQNKAIAVMPFTNGLQRTSGEGRADLFPAWSPDGRWIAYTSGPSAPEVMGGEPADRVMAQRRIWIMAADGSGQRPLTDDARYRDERPAWSTDGSYLLFGRLEGERKALWLMRADGAEARPVADDLGPSPGWFGYYGYLYWNALYDWWQGA